MHRILLVLLFLLGFGCVIFGFTAAVHADGSAGVDAGVTCESRSAMPTVACGDSASMFYDGCRWSCAPIFYQSPVASSLASSAIPPPVNPVADPAGYVSELSSAKSSGWGVLLLVLAFGLCEILAAAGKNVPALAWLGTGRVSILIGGGVAVGAAAIAALSSSGTWIAAGYAAVGAVLLYLHPAAADVAKKAAA